MRNVDGIPPNLRQYNSMVFLKKLGLVHVFILTQFIRATQ